MGKKRKFINSGSRTREKNYDRVTIYLNPDKFSNQKNEGSKFFRKLIDQRVNYYREYKLLVDNLYDIKKCLEEINNE